MTSSFVIKVNPLSSADIKRSNKSPRFVVELSVPKIQTKLSYTSVVHFHKKHKQELEHLTAKLPSKAICASSHPKQLRKAATRLNNYLTQAHKTRLAKTTRRDFLRLLGLTSAEEEKENTNSIHDINVNARVQLSSKSEDESVKKMENVKTDEIERHHTSNSTKASASAASIRIDKSEKKMTEKKKLDEVIAEHEEEQEREQLIVEGFELAVVGPPPHSRTLPCVVL